MPEELQRQIDAERNPDSKAGLLIKLVELLSKKGRMDEAYEALHKAESLARTDSVQLKCKDMQAHLLMASDRNKEALPILHELLEKVIEGNVDLDLALLYNQFGIAYRGIGDFDNCLRYYNMSYDVFFERNNIEGMAGTLINIGNVYRSYEKLDIALEHYRKAEEMIGDRNGFDEHKRLICSGMSVTCRKMKEFEKALEYNEKALAYCYQLEDIRGVCNTLNSMALLRKDQGRLDDALELYQSCLEIAEGKNYESMIATALANIGQTYSMKEVFDKAKDNLERGLVKAQEINAEHIIMQIYFMQAGMYAQIGNSEKTLESFIKYDKVKSKVLSKQTMERLHNLEIKFDLERKQHETEVYRLRNEELVAKNKQLEEAQNEIRNLERRNSIYAMAVTANHELNQPLMVIQGNLDLLEGTIESAGEKATTRLQKIRASLQRINDQLKKYRQFEDAHLGEYSADTPMFLFDEES